MTPSDNSLNETKLLNEDNAGRYRSFIRSLVYIELKTRLDISKKEYVFCRFTSRPETRHNIADQREFYYLH